MEILLSGKFRYFLDTKSYIGEGSNARIFKAFRDNQKDQLFAVKKLDLNHNKWKHIDAEIEIHSKLFHPNIIRLVDTIEGENSIYLVFEFAS